MNLHLKKLYDEYIAAGVEPVAAVALAVAEMPAREQPPYTVPEIAKFLRVRPDKVLTWIRAGELRGYNVTAKLGGRPKYRVNHADFLDFQLRRTELPAKRAGRPVASRSRPKYQGPTMADVAKCKYDW
jgi:excisionase family DNA binding protein